MGGDKARRIAIVGAGLAGLSAAIACARRGFEVTLIDRSPPGHEGTAVGVQGQALQVLDDYGLGEQVRASSTPLTGHFSDIPMVGCYRPDLVRLLAEEAARVGVACLYGSEAVAVGQEAGRAWVALEDGGRIAADLVVGADGIRSAIRGQLFGDEPEPAYAGQFHLRWIATGPHVANPPGMLVQDWGKYLGYPLPNERTYIIVVFNRAGTNRIPDAEAKALFSDYIRRFDDPYIQAWADRLGPDDEIRARPFEWLLLPGPWYKGRILLIGDAAHATTAHMSYGGGLALEDGAVLGTCLADADGLEPALADFMRRRFDRVQIVVRASVALSRGEQGIDVGEQERSLIPRAFALFTQDYREAAPAP
jgi:2-polyprenyl-6-methoxyphenol hydroxylase-like FAD-dependent oxidoreductase